MNVFRNIDRNKIMFDFLLYEPYEEGYEQEARDLGAKIYYYSPRRKGLKKYAKSLKDFYRNHAHEYSAVHYSANTFSDIYPVVLAKKYGIPIRILHSHSSKATGLHNKIFHHINRLRAPHVATHYLACSEMARIWGFGGTTALKKATVIPNGIDLGLFKFNPQYRKEIRDELKIQNKTLICCHIGNFLPVKNHPFLLQIFSELKKEKEDCILLLCGSGPKEQEIRDLIKIKGLESSVRILGLRSDINKILSASDVVIFPSIYEGLPFTLIEAQASALPVYGSDRISHDIILTNKIWLLPLEQNPSYWSTQILKTDFKNRDNRDLERLKSYDIHKTIEVLSNIYLDNKNT